MTGGIYHVVMKTTMGKKYGTLRLYINKSVLSGSISILGKNNEIHGVIQSDGSCRFSGELLTPMRCMKFWADGFIEEERVNLLIHSDTFLFPVSGEREICK